MKSFTIFLSLYILLLHYVTAAPAPRSTKTLTTTTTLLPSTITSDSDAIPTAIIESDLPLSGFKIIRRQKRATSITISIDSTPTSPPAKLSMIRIRRSITSGASLSIDIDIATSITSELPSSTPEPTSQVRSNILIRDLSVVNLQEVFHSRRISIKKGLCFSDPLAVAAFGNNSLVWAYNSASATDASILNLGLGFIPMLFNSNSDGWLISAQNAINAGAKHLLAFNEPNIASQANLSPAAAAASWKMNMEPFALQGIKLISPAVTNGPDGISWMKEFMVQCNGCHVDGIAVHWYNSASNIKYFYSYLNLVHNIFGIPLWLTEFAGTGTIAEQKLFLQNVLPFLERSPQIMAYSAFAGSLVDASGTLTELGVVYKNTV